jgi:hypothetical protein
LFRTKSKSKKTLFVIKRKVSMLTVIRKVGIISMRM